jgi:hypothetical protein
LSGTTSSTNILTSSTNVLTSSTSVLIISATNQACQALETGFVLGPIGLVLLLPYLVY